MYKQTTVMGRVDFMYPSKRAAVGVNAARSNCRKTSLSFRKKGNQLIRTGRVGPLQPLNAMRSVSEQHAANLGGTADRFPSL